MTQILDVADPVVIQFKLLEQYIIVESFDSLDQIFAEAQELIYRRKTCVRESNERLTVSFVQASRPSIFGMR